MKAPENFFISPNPDRLDIGAITQWVQSSYWGGWQTEQQVREALQHSIVIGIYEHLPRMPVPERGPDDVELRGFARIVTDHATFSALTDLYISAPFRKRGLGTMLMNEVIAHPAVKSTICILATRPENYGWYQLFGFQWLGGMVMKRDPKP